MKSMLSAVLVSVVVAVGVVACGGEEKCPPGTCAQQEQLGEVQQVQDTACRPDTCPPGGGGDGDPVPVYKALTVRLRNASAVTRQCSDVVVAAYDDSGTLVSTTVAHGGLVGAGGEIGGTIYFLQGTTVSVNGGCWRIGYPNTEHAYGGWPVSLTANKTCSMIYNSDGEFANIYMECASN